MSKLSPGTLLLAIVAILFGLLGTYVLRLRLRPDVEAANEQATQTQLVPMASTDLPTGRRIALGDIALTRMTRGQMSQAGIRGQFMNQPNQIIGRVLSQSVSKGGTFTSDLLYPEGVFPSLANQLQPGFRAVTVNVEGPAAVAGFARPGAYVDVLFRANKDEEEDLPETTITLVEAANVIALDQQTLKGAKAGQNNKRTQQMAITLEVRPEQALTLRIVEGRGKLWLALRNPHDNAPLATASPRTFQDVLARPSRRWRTEQYRSTRLTQMDFRTAEQSETWLKEVAEADDRPKEDDGRGDGSSERQAMEVEVRPVTSGGNPSKQGDTEA